MPNKKNSVQTQPPKLDKLPPWKIILHNDDFNEPQHVVSSIYQLTPLKWNAAQLRMLEAHNTGAAFLLTTHKEHAELIQQQLISKRLTVTIEPLEK